MKGRRSRGFKLGRRVVGVFRWGFAGAGTVSRFFKVLKDKTKRLRGSGKSIRVGQEPPEMSPAEVPNGHLAVYVGGGDEATCRVIIPVVYFNHPHFAELLRRAENIYGFDQPGGIQIPCRKSEFESVKMRIASACGGCNRRGWRGWRV